ncbi:DUF1579 domain-containing protein [Planctomycetes bacterium K23_9]|uniref:DUF1579 domain-containing protein n=1 Tax=Stieleria marina TaxID=1930275 RepID=A0A517NTC9_9BACT|nr:hypothetical protein K239x_23360 [Planctomycetes bacterium K23_9]
MKFLKSIVIAAALVSCLVSESNAQNTPIPKPGPEFDVLKADVGVWDVTIKTWAGPGQPTISKGKETNRMLGGFWLLADFQGSMMGADFQGHGMYSYDAAKNRYVGTWVDSMSASKMEIVGTYNADKKTMTYEGMAPGMDGKPAKHVLKTVYSDDGTHVFKMHVHTEAGAVKVFEMSYARAEGN